MTENAERNGSAEVSKSYLDFLYAPEGQKILAEHFYRVHDETAQAAFAANFPEVKLVDVDETFGGWEKIKAEHFAEGGILDTVFVNQ